MGSDHDDARVSESNMVGQSGPVQSLLDSFQYDPAGNRTSVRLASAPPTGYPGADGENR